MGLIDVLQQSANDFNKVTTSLYTLVFQFLPGYGQELHNRVNSLYLNQPVPIDALIKLRQSENIDKSHYYTLMQLLGYNNDIAEDIYTSQLQLLSLNEVMTLYFRYRDTPNNIMGIAPGWLKRFLERSGIDSRYENYIKEAYRPVPTIQDILVFADRDVYNPEIVQRLGLLEGIDKNPNYLLETRSRGMADIDAKYYWAAHWRPPSLNMAFEMYQRLQDHPDPTTRFTLNDLNAFHDIQETPPGMRKSLNAIAYNTITRVDMRRMYRLGIFGRGEEAKAQLIVEYRKLGYSTEVTRKNGQSDASLMADFTIKNEAPQEKELTRSQIERFYLDGVFDSESDPVKIVKDRLEAIGYIPDDIDLITEYIVNKRLEEDNKLLIAEIELDFIKGIISSEAELSGKLVALNLPAGQVKITMSRIIHKKKTSAKRISLSDYENAVRLGIVDSKDYEKRLEEEFFPKEDIKILVEMIELESSAATNEPTKEDLLTWASSGIIDIDTFKQRMKKKGYANTDIELYILSLGV